MPRRAAALLPALAAALAAPSARAVDCPELLGHGPLSFEQRFDTSAPPDEPFGTNVYLPIAAIHAVAIDVADPVDFEDQAWCHDLTGDSISLGASNENPGVAEGRSSASVADGRFGVYAFGSVPESDDQTPRSGSSLVQIGFRDVIALGGTGTDPVPLTLHRSIDGDWTSEEGHGNTLYVFGTRTFTLTIHELANPNVPGPNTATQRLVIDDDEGVGFLNGEADYVFDATPGHVLVLTLYLEAGVDCAPFLSFQQVSYEGCLSFVDFSGGPFGAPIALGLSAPPGYPLAADSGYLYAPEPFGPESAAAAWLALAALRRTSRSRRIAS